MFFVSDEFELSANSIAIVTKAYPSTKVKNIGNTSATLLQSKDGSTWSELKTLATNQETTINLDMQFIYLMFKEDTKLYFYSQTPDYYHPNNISNGTSTNIDIEPIKEQITALNRLANLMVSTQPQTLSQEQKDQVRNNLSLASSEQVNAILEQLDDFLSLNPQILTDEQKNLLRTKIDTISTQLFNEKITAISDKLTPLLSSEPQILTDEAKKQVRANINAIGLDELSLLSQSGFIKEFQTGTITLLDNNATGGVANGRYWTTTFSKPFTSKPFVIVAPSTPHNRLHYISGIKEREFTYATNYVDTNQTIQWLAFTVDKNYQYNPDSNEIQKQINLLDNKFNSYVSLDELYDVRNNILSTATENGNTLGELENQIKALQGNTGSTGLKLTSDQEYHFNRLLTDIQLSSFISVFSTRPYYKEFVPYTGTFNMLKGVKFDKYESTSNFTKHNSAVYELSIGDYNSESKFIKHDIDYYAVEFELYHDDVDFYACHHLEFYMSSCEWCQVIICNKPVTSPLNIQEYIQKISDSDYYINTDDEVLLVYRENGSNYILNPNQNGFNTLEASNCDMYFTSAALNISEALCMIDQYKVLYAGGDFYNDGGRIKCYIFLKPKNSNPTLYLSQRNISQ